ncbi:MAG: GIY-YIG nuclease family protein [Chitinophagaceae bacterium]|nr:GIY-YIG nuclease family protein [Chitinophagaceae bacterium]
MYHVYILYSVSYNKIYVGYTSNLAERLRSHNELGKKGWTIKFRPWQLIHTESFVTKQEALYREKALKSGQGREWIWEKLISPPKLVGLLSA